MNLEPAILPRWATLSACGFARPAFAGRLRVLGRIAWLAVIAALAGCQPITSEDSIYNNAYREPDPAIRSPHLERGAPGLAESAAVRAAARPKPTPLAPAATAPAIRSADPVSALPPFKAWVDGQLPGGLVVGRAFRLARPISEIPMVRFDLDASMGAFRSAVIQVYRVANDRLDLASGIRMKDDADGRVLVPGKDVSLCRPGKSVTIRQIVTNEVLPWVELKPGEEYEIQFLIGGTLQSGSLAVRARVSVPAATQPSVPPPADPNQPDKTRLPPGVVIP